MDKDRIVGSAKDFAGKVEGAVGEMTGDAKTQAEGRAREARLTSPMPPSTTPRTPTRTAATPFAAGRKLLRKPCRIIRLARCWSRVE